MGLAPIFYFILKELIFLMFPSRNFFFLKAIKTSNEPTIY